MRKFMLVMGCIVIAGLFVGCTTMAKGMPSVSVPLQGLNTTDSYYIIGPAEGTSTGGYLFGFIPVGVEYKAGSIAGAGQMSLLRGGAGRPGGFSPVARAAVYNAIESVPEADALLAPRWEKVTKNYLIYSEQTVTVKGKAVRYGR